MGRKEKLKNQRKAEQKVMEVSREESHKKGKVFALLLLLACLAAYEINIALHRDQIAQSSNQPDDPATVSTASTPAGEVKGEAIAPDVATSTEAATTPATAAAQLVLMETDKGAIKLELYAADAPKTVENFLKLSRAGFYDGIRFHRIEPGFVIQAGDPVTKGEVGKDFVYDRKNNPQNLPVAGTGGPGYSFEDEINSHKNVVGALAMANSGPDTNGSQFYIITEKDQPSLDGGYTVFGKVLEGMDVVLKMQQGDRILKLSDL